MTETRRDPSEAAAQSHQVVCLSCGYRRAWPTVVEAIADGHRHHAEHASCERPALVTPATPIRDKTGPAEATRTPSARR